MTHDNTLVLSVAFSVYLDLIRAGLTESQAHRFVVDVFQDQSSDLPHTPEGEQQ